MDWIIGRTDLLESRLGFTQVYSRKAKFEFTRQTQTWIHHMGTGKEHLVLVIFELVSTQPYMILERIIALLLDRQVDRISNNEHPLVHDFRMDHWSTTGSIGLTA